MTDCNNINIPERKTDPCNGFEIKDTCVEITKNFPELGIYKGDNMQEAVTKIIKYILLNE